MGRECEGGLIHLVTPSPPPTHTPSLSRSAFTAHTSHPRDQAPRPRVLPCENFQSIGSGRMGTDPRAPPLLWGQWYPRHFWICRKTPSNCPCAKPPTTAANRFSSRHQPVLQVLLKPTHFLNRRPLHQLARIDPVARAALAFLRCLSWWPAHQRWWSEAAPASARGTRRPKNPEHPAPPTRSGGQRPHKQAIGRRGIAWITQMARLYTPPLPWNVCCRSRVTCRSAEEGPRGGGRETRATGIVGSSATPSPTPSRGHPPTSSLGSLPGPHYSKRPETFRTWRVDAPLELYSEPPPLCLRALRKHGRSQGRQSDLCSHATNRQTAAAGGGGDHSAIR